MNDWLFWYLLGCVAAFTLLCFNGLFFWLVRWITRANVVLANFKKLAEPDESSWLAKIAKAILKTILEVACSWLSVVFGIFVLARFVLETIRDVFTSVPEKVRSLRFPLRYNEDLSREAVWAHVIGLAVVTGQSVAKPSDLFGAIDEISEKYPTFDRRSALLQLKGLRVVDEEVMDGAISALDARQTSQDQGRSYSPETSETFCG